MSVRTRYLLSLNDPLNADAHWPNTMASDCLGDSVALNGCKGSAYSRSGHPKNLNRVPMFARFGEPIYTRPAAMRAVAFAPQLSPVSSAALQQLFRHERREQHVPKAHQRCDLGLLGKHNVSLIIRRQPFETLAIRGESQSV